MLTDKQKALMMEYAELDGEVTLKLEEVEIASEVQEQEKVKETTTEADNLLEKFTTKADNTEKNKEESKGFTF